MASSAAGDQRPVWPVGAAGNANPKVESTASSTRRTPGVPTGTVGLLRSVPRLNEPRQDLLQTISGLPPDLAHQPPGCAFAPRCFLATDECWAAEPQLEPTDHDRLSACFRRDKLRESAPAEVPA